MANCETEEYVQRHTKFRPDISTLVKTNGRHIEILVRVSIVTNSLPAACGFPSAYQISSKPDHPRQSYEVIAIFKMVTVSHVGFGLW